MKLAAALACLAIGCHAHPKPTRPRSPEERASEALRAWGTALEHGDSSGLARAEDRSGQYAVVYAATKLGASHFEGGAESVEATLIANVLVNGLTVLFDGTPETVPVVLPNAVVSLPWDQTVGRLEKSLQDHHERLVERRAWTCKLVSIERTVLPSEPVLVRAAAVSTTIFAGWLRDVDAIWLVHANCDGRVGAFAISGHSRRDVVLAASVL